MSIFALIDLADGTQLHWIATGGTGGGGGGGPGILLGRYERCTNAIQTLVAQILSDATSAFPSIAPLVVTFPNGPAGQTVGSGTPMLGGSGVASTLSVIVAVNWRTSKRRGMAAAAATDAYRFSGTLSISLLAPRTTAEGTLVEVADFIADRERWQDDGELHYLTPRVLRQAFSRANWARTVEVPFYVDEDNARIANAIGTVNGFDAIGEAIRSRWELLIGTDACPTVYDNMPSPARPSNAPWVDLELIYGDSELNSLGVPTTSRFGNTGTLQATINVDLGTSVGVPMALADAIWDAFHNVADRGVKFMTPAVVAADRSGSYWRTIVQVPFQAETIQ